MTATLKDHASRISAQCAERGANKKIGMVSGNFNVVHPGHLRLLKFATDCCDILVVAVNADDRLGVLVPAHLRLENIAAISYVDYAFILEDDLADAIDTIRPDLIVKGKEHQELHNPERDALAAYGGKLLFSSGDAVFSSIDLIQAESERPTSNFNLKSSANYLNRHNIRSEDFSAILDRFDNLNVLVIGDLIIDEYITCDVLGLSREDPTIVVTPVLEQKFIGGAGIVASHARGLGAKTSYLTVCGDDHEATDGQKKLEDYGVEVILARDPSRSTTLKQRFRSAGKTLLRVSKLKQHAIEQSLQDEIFDHFTRLAANLDLLVFSDFNYGVLPQSLVNRIAAYCRERQIPMVADSQTSSQIGNIARFEKMLLLKPTEVEARLAIQNHDIGLVAVAEALARKCDPEHILLTLGAEGTLIQTTHPDKSAWMTDRLPALCASPKDPAGAGDAMLVSASLALACGASIWEAAYIGSVASGCQVATVGNRPLSIDEIRHELGVL
ncbi:PfkB family carbohydrate kinase [Sneathiella sp. HT1-7]|uniref:PfkB family carbohydrate kinase n=1 Tax=Sneathiella sp. HT1-7 TaxID=2887192 RepID=UPI001D148440|nr:PfkB family carbohydrate kinase [Sneathiella sp. HT1-7]MCC3305343.1 PfkB family carbohydrate kinase [Sneathiella sp. HT1-7]